MPSGDSRVFFTKTAVAIKANRTEHCHGALALSLTKMQPPVAVSPGALLTSLAQGTVAGVMGDSLRPGTT